MLSSVSDTLRVDTAMLDVWRSDSEYDYAREMVQSDFSLREWIIMHIGRWLDSIFGSDFYADNEKFIWGIIASVLILAVVAFVFRKKIRLFTGTGKETLPYDVTEDTIYGIDFPKEISMAMERMDYREAVRLTYLYALKELTDCGRIDWQPYKTPTQYIAEMGTQDFRHFSNHFLRVRYGNFEATEELADLMQQLRLRIIGDEACNKEGGSL